MVRVFKRREDAPKGAKLRRGRLVLKSPEKIKSEKEAREKKKKQKEALRRRLRQTGQSKFV